MNKRLFLFGGGNFSGSSILDPAQYFVSFCYGHTCTHLPSLARINMCAWIMSQVNSHCVTTTGVFTL